MLIPVAKFRLPPGSPVSPRLGRSLWCDRYNNETPLQPSILSPLASGYRPRFGRCTSRNRQVPELERQGQLPGLGGEVPLQRDRRVRRRALSLTFSTVVPPVA